MAATRMDSDTAHALDMLRRDHRLAQDARCADGRLRLSVALRPTGARPQEDETMTHYRPSTDSPTQYIDNLDPQTRLDAGETVDHLIARSIMHNEIAHADYDADYDAADAIVAMLEARADGRAENGDTLEYWGSDDDGREWRVHITRDNE